MKLRKLDPQHYYDEETGTHFDLPLLMHDNFEQAEAMIQMDVNCFFSRCPEGKYWGARRTVLPISYIPPS